MSKTIMLIHGAWLNSKSWEGFKARYEAKGYTVITPDWPFDDRDPAELRASPRPELAPYWTARGHRPFRALDPRTARRADPNWPFDGRCRCPAFARSRPRRCRRRYRYRANALASPLVGTPSGLRCRSFSIPFSWRKNKVMSRRYFKTRFAQTAPKDQADELYDRYIIPTPGKVYWDGVINTLKIDWKNPKRAPLLLIAGEIDLIADASMIHKIYEKQRQAPAITEFKLFEGRSHWTGIDAGWEEVADYALDWAVSHARPSSVTPITQKRAA